MNARTCLLMLALGAGRIAGAPPDAGVIPPRAALLSHLPEAPTITASEILALVRPGPSLPRPAVPPLPSPDPGETAVVVVPDADGVIDETGAVLVGDNEGIPNPFRMRDRPAPSTREERLTVESILVAGRPDRCAAVINGRICSPGENLDGLRVAAISAETIELRHNRLLLRMPVQDGPVTLRLLR
jgi:hypothetical protein